MKRKQGFTLIEVSLFLAITGLLFLMVVTGVQGSVDQQRYNDSVQSFVELLRTAYSEVTNVQHTDTGQNDKAVYGKLITFGESYNLNTGEPIGEDDADIFVYTVIGDADATDISTSGALEMLKRLKASVREDGTEPNTEGGFAGIVETYKPKWGAEIYDGNGNKMKGALLIVRHPRSGTVYTFVKDDAAVQINAKEKLASYLPDGGGSGSMFEKKEIDFCIRPQGGERKGNRADVRISNGSKGASGVEVLYDDSSNVCNDDN